MRSRTSCSGAAADRPPPAPATPPRTRRLPRPCSGASSSSFPTCRRGPHGRGARRRRDRRRRATGHLGRRFARELGVLWAVWRLVAGRIVDVEFFDIDRRGERPRPVRGARDDRPAHARAGQRGRASRHRHAWLLRHDLAAGFEQAVDLMAPDLVQIDRRKGVSQAGHRRPGPAARGARLVRRRVPDRRHHRRVPRGPGRPARAEQLARPVGRRSGFELTGLDVTELDEDGRQCRIVTFDEDDLAAALEEMERRHEELSGEAYAAVEHTYAAGERGIQPRRHGWRARPPESGDVDGGPPRGRRRGGAR